LYPILIPDLGGYKPLDRQTMLWRNVQELAKLQE